MPEPGRAGALDLARPFGDEQPGAPPLAPAAQPDDLLHARVVDRGDHPANLAVGACTRAPSRPRAG